MAANTAPFGQQTASRVRRFFGAEPTPLVALSSVAASLGLSGVYVKDESKRLGQQAFKVYGATFGMATWIARRLNISLDDVQGLEDLRAKCSASDFKQVTFVTCTDGNHGRAVSWAAKQLGQRAVVYMPKGSAAARVAHVHANDGECTVTDLNYDDTVALASRKADENNWVLLQDTAFGDYTEIPTWIMQGYTAMVDEALEQMQGTDQVAPTHVVLQVGVGSMAAAVLGYLVERSTAEGVTRPKVMTLEPKNAACAFASAENGDGKVVEVEGDLDTMIAGLACGVPSDLAWPILSQHVDAGYFWIEDGIAGNGMRAMATEGVESGECGGAGLGLIQRLMSKDCSNAAKIREQIGLSADSRVLIFNTEGITDPENYKLQLSLPDVLPADGDFGFAKPLSLSNEEGVN